MKAVSLTSLLAGCCFACCPATVFAELHYAVLANTGDIATGSSAADGRPDGTFTFAANIFEFEAPAAGRGGFATFRAAAQMVLHPLFPSTLRGSWRREPQGLAVQLLTDRAAPASGGGFTGTGGDSVMNESGDVAFWGQWINKGVQPNVTGTGLWWSRAGAGTVPALEPVAISGTTGPGSPQPFTGFGGRPLHNGNFIGFAETSGVWSFDKTLQSLRRVSWPGMEVPAFGNGIALSSVGTILGMDETGRFLLQASATDGGTWLFRAGGAPDPAPVFRTGQDAPGLPGRRIGAMLATVNHRGEVALLTRLTDDDANPLNDISAIYAGPEGAVSLVVHSGAPLPGMPAGIWGGQPLLSREGHLLAAGGILRLPQSPQDTLTFTALPFIPGATGFPDYSLNALGQLAASVAIGNAASLWLFNPGDGWLEVARAGQSLTLPGGAVTVNKIGVLTGSAGGDGKASGLANDGVLCFAVNGRMIVSADANPASGFVFANRYGSNWHATGADPPNNWDASDGSPREGIPGDIEQHTAEVTIPPGSAVQLDQRPAPIGLLNAAGTLTLKNALTVHRNSMAEILTIAGPSAMLAVDGSLFETTGELRVEDAASINLSGGILRSRRPLTALTGLISGNGDAEVQLRDYLEKSGPGLFQVTIPLHGSRPDEVTTPQYFYGIRANGGILQLTGGGSFAAGSGPINVYVVSLGGGTLRMAGEWQAHGPLLITGSGLELGTASLDAVLSPDPASAIQFFGTDTTVRFLRGRLEGLGTMDSALATFSWEGGRIDIAGNAAPGSVTGGFQNRGTLEIFDPPVTPRVLSGLFRNEKEVTQEGSVSLEAATIVQDNAAAVWTLRGGRIGTSAESSVFDHRRGKLIAENNSEIHARYEGGANSTLLVRDTLTMFGGADWQDRSLDLESDFSELRLDAPAGPPQTYTLRHALDEEVDALARLTVRNAVLRLPRNRSIKPLLTLEEGSQITTYSPPTGAQNFDDAVNLRHAVWRGGTIGGPVTPQDFILLPGETTIEGSAGHVLDATLLAGDVMQRSPVTFTDRGFVVIDRYTTTVARWVIRAPAGLSGNGTFRNGGSLIAEPDPPGLVEIGLHLRLLIADFSCGSPDRDNTGTILRFTNTNEARPAPGNALVSGSWTVHRGGVLDLTGPPIGQIGNRATVSLFGGTLTPFAPRQNSGRLHLRSSSVNVQAPGDLENRAGAQLTLEEDATLNVAGACTNHGLFVITTGAEVTVAGPFTQSASGFLEVSALSTLRLQGGGALAGHVGGRGVIIGDVQLPGRTSPGSSPGQLAITGSAALSSASAFEAELSGTAAGQSDLLSVSGAATVDGTLAVILLSGFRPAAADAFTVIQAGTLTGRFANAPHGQRLATVDGYGSFLVSYSGTAVTLSDFAANPNPPPSVLPVLPAPEILFSDTSEPLLSFQLSGSPGRPYRIESSPDLQTWTLFHSAVLPSAGAEAFELPFDTTSHPRLYYRARAE